MAEVAKGIIDIEINTGSAASTLQALQAQINAFNLALNKGNKSQAQFSGEYTKKLQEAINKTGLFTAETIRLETAAATLDKTLSKGKTSLGQYFSARFNKDGAIAAETMALASERARRLQTQFIATSGAAGGFQNALAVRPLAAFSTEMAVAGQKAEIMSAMFKQGTTQLINFGKNVQWAGRQLMVGFTVPLTIFGAVAGKTFMELEKQVVSFKKVYGDLFTTPAELNQNLEAVKGLASEYTKYGIAVKDTIGLAAQAAAAGRKNADLTDAVSQATRLATLGQMDQNAALETTISLQSAFRLSGQDLADTINFLNMVENQTVVSLQDIAAAIPRVAPVISGLGGDVKDLTVFLAAMQEGGVDAAEGANALKSGLASLINPTKQATAMLSGMGINLESIIQMNKGDLMGTVQSFAQALGALDQFSRQQALEQVFGKFQYAKLGALFDNISRKGSQAQQVIATMGYTTEQLGSTADKELKTIEESFGVQLTGAVERFKLAIAPIGEIFVKLAIPLVNLATKFAEAFNGLSDGQKKFAAIGAVVIGVVVPAVTMLTGLFLNLIGTLAKMTQGITLFGKGLITGGPIGAFKALTQSSKYLSLAEMDAAMAAQQLAGANEVLNATLVQQVGSSNAAATAIGNLTKAYAAMIATQANAALKYPEVFGLAGASGAAAAGGTGGGRAKAAQVFMRGVQRRNSGGPIFMSNGTTVPGTGNTDTVPAMLTPGEFVVNKEATKNNLGLLHSINDTKNPQGLNTGGKAKGMQYFAKDNPPLVLNAEPTLQDIKDLGKVEGGFEYPSPETRTSQIQQGINDRSIGNLYEVFDNSRFMTKQGLATGIFPAWMNEALKTNQRGLKAKDLLKYLELAGPEFLDPTRIAFLEAIDPNTGVPLGQVFDSTEAHSKMVKMLKTLDPNDLIHDTHGNPSKSLESILNNSVKAQELSTLRRLRSPEFSGSFRISGTGRGNPEAKALIIQEQVDLINDYYRRNGTLGPNESVYHKIVGYSSGKPYNAFYLPDNTHVGTYLPGETKPISGNIPKYDTGPYKQSKIDLAKKLSRKKLPGKTGALVSGLSFVLAHLNSGGQVPGMQYFAANNRQRVVQEAYKAASGIRRRVRPGRDERFSQQAVLKDYVHDAKFIRRNPEDMDTLTSMLKPLTQQTRATRGTVLGATDNPELPYAQQKRIVSAIKEGRYEDLFGMKLNFKGPGSYTTRRETDFAPFIGDLSNPTLKSFSRGFMDLKRQKEEVAQLRKIMRSGKFKKLTPGTVEYARELGMTGLWSPARSFRPGPNPVIGSDWTIEQVLANRLRDYNSTKKWVGKTFPDKKIQQLLIDEMVGSGTLALDVQKSFYKHPRLPYRGDHIENLVKKENEILLGNRTSQITGVATDLRTKLPSLITQSGARGYNKGGMIPGVQYLNSGTQVLKLLQNQKQFGFMSNPSNPFAFDAAFLTGAKGSNPVGTWARTLGGSKNPKDTLEFLFSNDETKSTVLPMIGAMLVNARAKGVSGLSPSTSLSADSSALVKKLQDRGILGKEYSSEITNAYDKADAGSQIAQAVRSVSGEIDLKSTIGKGYHALLPKDLDTFGEVARMLLRSKGRENISQEEATTIMNEIIKRGTLDDFLKSESNFSSLRFNSGNIVPGMGNTDTVPAMLTPGEFVVNKEATKNNLGLLHQINGSQKLNSGGMAYQGSREAPPRLLMNSGGVAGYNGGGVMYGPDTEKVSSEKAARNSKVSGRAVGAGMAGTVVAGTAGFMLAEKAGIDSMAGQFGASIVAGMVAQKALAAATIKMSKNTMTAAEKTKALAPWLSKVAPSLARFAVPLMGATVGFALLGFGVYKLNKSLVSAEKSGAALSDAMYGSAKTTKAMADAFGRETYATASRRKAAEKAGGQEITQEAVVASSEFMKSDAAKGIVKDIKLVEKSGGDAVLALRNQLASSIIAGVISPEEARAIALDVGKELGSATLGVQVSGELSSLIGPNGEKILDNVIQITADISPKIDYTKIQKGGQKAFDSLNPGEKFIQFFKGGQESFVSDFSIDQISSANASALAKEAEARALLNLAYQEGTITLKEYLDQEGKITSGASERSSFIDNANAKALGFSSTEAMQSKLQEQLANLNVDTTGMSKVDAENAVNLGQARAREDSQGKAAYEAIVTKSKDALNQTFVDSGMDADIAKTMTDSMEKGVAQIDPGIFDKFLSGQIPLEGYDVVMNLESSGDLTLEDIDRLGKELTALTTIPKIDKVINFETANEEMITELYDDYMALEKEPDIFKGISIKDNLAQNAMEQFGINYQWIMGLPNQEKFIVLTTIERHIELRKAAVSGDKSDREALAASNGELSKLVQNTVVPQTGPTGPTGNGGKGDDAKNKFENLKNMLMQRFKLQEMLIDKEAEGVNKTIKGISREIQLQQRQIALEEKQIEVRQKALNELSKKEDEVNTVYNDRISALDRVSKSNSRLASQEQSRISFASALASGDIAGAASAMSEMTQQSAENQIEDSRTALETQRENALKNLTVDVNGTLMTRKDIEASIETIQGRIEIIQTSIYNKNILMQTEEDKLLKIEDKRLKVAQDREKIETRLYLLEQKKAYDELNKKKNKKQLTAEERQALADYKASYNSMATFYNSQNPNTPVQLLNLGGQVSGTGMTDKVPAMLTPGEFVVRKNAAQAFLPVLQSINSGLFPSVGGMNLDSPRYDVPASSITNVPVSNSITNSSNASTMYNNSYSINVNVSGSNSSADEIANVVMGKIARSNSGSIRGSRY